MSTPAQRPVVAIDYTAAVGHAPGVGRYARELVRALVRLPASGIGGLRLVEVGRGPRPMEGAPLGLEGSEVRLPTTRRRIRLPRRAFGLAARMPGVARASVAGDAALLHRVHAHWPPAGDVPSTLAVTELPRRGAPGEGAFASAVRSAAGVLVFSDDARDRVAARYDVPDARLHRVPVGCDHWERDVDLDEVTARPTRDVLVLGAIRSSRAPLAALRGFEALRERNVRARLLLVGRAGDAADAFRVALAASPARADVRWIDDPREASMPGCVAGACVLLHLAEDEATPVTPLEAARFGLPVVASPLPAFREALGDELRTVDGDDPAALGAALADALEASEDADVRARMKELGLTMTWRGSAAAHVAAWEATLGSPFGSPTPHSRRLDR
ncbi:MAG: glycosyltransferase [Planctomycetota bacterium]